MGSNQFGRIYRLEIGQQNGDGRIIQGGYDTSESLRITFQITKTTSEAPNTSEIKVYNLAPQTRALLEKPDTVCKLYCGYREGAGAVLMHQGNVIFGYSQRDGANWVTTFQLADTFVATRDSMISLALKSGAKASDAIKALANNLGTPLNMAKDALDRTWKHGVSFQGLSKNALSQIVRATGLEHSFQNGTLQVINQGGTTSNLSPLISPDSGLLGYPERLREGSQMAAAVVDQQTPSAAKDVKYLTGLRLRFNGWRITTLLQPGLNAGDPLVLQSNTVKGTFRIENIRHMGDSHEGDWVSHIDLLAPEDYNVKKAQESQKAAKRAVSIAKAKMRAQKNA